MARGAIVKDGCAVIPLTNFGAVVPEMVLPGGILFVGLVIGAAANGTESEASGEADNHANQ